MEAFDEFDKFDMLLARYQRRREQCEKFDIFDNSEGKKRVCAQLLLERIEKILSKELRKARPKDYM